MRIRQAVRRTSHRGSLSCRSRDRPSDLAHVPARDGPGRDRSFPISAGCRACSRGGAVLPRFMVLSTQSIQEIRPRSAADVYNNAILPYATGLAPSALTYSVTWQTSNSPTRAISTSIPPGLPMRNTVTVTVTYTWGPSLYKVGTLPLSSTSTSVVPMFY